jgi:hypothetical protein
MSRFLHIYKIKKYHQPYHEQWWRNTLSLQTLAEQHKRNKCKLLIDIYNASKDGTRRIKTVHKQDKSWKQTSGKAYDDQYSTSWQLKYHSPLYKLNHETELQIEP